jgi:hypothetical protein
MPEEFAPPVQQQNTGGGQQVAQPNLASSDKEFVFGLAFSQLCPLAQVSLHL